jgi:predicted  nucleic acid-binding Zn-ribbon protein
MKTYEDLERQAYIRGDIALANLYSKAIELDCALNNEEELCEEIYDLRHENSKMENEISDLEADVEFYRQKAVRAEAKLEEIAAKIEE